jgi:hypothetical protein
VVALSLGYPVVTPGEADNAPKAGPEGIEKVLDGVSLVEAQSGDDESDHATCVVAGVAVRADTEIADAAQQFVGIRVGANLARRGSSVEQSGAHRDEAVEEIGVQGLEGGIVGLFPGGEVAALVDLVEVAAGSATMVTRRQADGLRRWRSIRLWQKRGR